jgi:hypothetical protein
MIAQTLITVLFLLLVCLTLFYIFTLYFANLFISYRGGFGIRTKANEPLSFSDYLTMLANMYNNQYFSLVERADNNGYGIDQEKTIEKSFAQQPAYYTQRD